MSATSSRARLAPGLVVALLASGCATSSIRGDVSDVRELTRVERIAQVADVDVDPAAHDEARRALDRPLDADAAVRVALLNNRELRATLREMGVARGRLVQAGLLPNPTVEGELLPEQNSHVELRVEYDVTSAVLESVSSRPGAKVAHRIVAALAWFVTALSTVVFPRNAWRTPVRFASAAALGIGGGLIALGSVLNWDAATSTGWPVAGAGLAALVLSFVGRMARRRLAFAVKLLLVILVLALAGYGGWQLWDQVR